MARIRPVMVALVTLAGVAAAQGAPRGAPPPVSVDASVFTAMQVDRPVKERANSARPVYPAALRRAGLQGDVTVEFVVDTAGWVELASVRVLRSNDVALTDAVLATMPGLRYDPAVLRAAPVRQIERRTFEFAIPGVPRDGAPVLTAEQSEVSRRGWASVAADVMPAAARAFREIAPPFSGIPSVPTSGARGWTLELLATLDTALGKPPVSRTVTVTGMGGLARIDVTTVGSPMRTFLVDTDARAVTALLPGLRRAIRAPLDRVPAVPPGTPSARPQLRRLFMDAATYAEPMLNMTTIHKRNRMETRSADGCGPDSMMIDLWRVDDPAIRIMDAALGPLMRRFTSFTGDTALTPFRSAFADSGSVGKAVVTHFAGGRAALVETVQVIGYQGRIVESTAFEIPSDYMIVDITNTAPGTPPADSSSGWAALTAALETAAPRAPYLACASAPTPKPVTRP